MRLYSCFSIPEGTTGRNCLQVLMLTYSTKAMWLRSRFWSLSASEDWLVPKTLLSLAGSYSHSSLNIRSSILQNGNEAAISRTIYAENGKHLLQLLSIFSQVYITWESGSHHTSQIFRLSTLLQDVRAYHCDPSYWISRILYIPMTLDFLSLSLSSAMVVINYAEMDQPPRFSNCNRFSLLLLSTIVSEARYTSPINISLLLAEPPSNSVEHAPFRQSGILVVRQTFIPGRSQWDRSMALYKLNMCPRQAFNLDTSRRCL